MTRWNCPSVKDPETSVRYNIGIAVTRLNAGCGVRGDESHEGPSFVTSGFRVGFE